LLTVKREDACCVKRNYVRSIYDYFSLSEDESKNRTEALKIEPFYITNWEKLHDTYVGVKRPEDLTVCYLCGPEPDNDFKEFMNLGVLPHNIWGFEVNSQNYNKAVSFYNQGTYPQPRILKQNVETFFQQTPKKFDIIYIDACGSIPSVQHALRTITTICQYHRLNSPGIIISNFAEPDNSKESIEEYYDLITLYLFFKTFPLLESSCLETRDRCDEYLSLYDNVIQNFAFYYGEFISAVLRDIPSILVPLQRFARNPFINQLFDISEFDKVVISELTVNHSLAKFFFAMDNLNRKGALNDKEKCFLNELGGYNDLIKGLKIITLLKQHNIKLKDDVKLIENFFESSEKIYQFLDKPHSNIFFDVIINQLAYPLHYNTEQNIRYKYMAKSTSMYMDITIYDECRYIYEWLPALHQIVSAFENSSWQYVFRFALDGLVKSRKRYNNEFFFQGSVVPSSVDEFKDKEIRDRVNIN